MKLKKEFITYSGREGQLMVSVDTKLFSGMVRSNETAAFIIESLKKEQTEESLTDLLAQTYEGSREQMAADVRRITSQLRQIGALDE